MSGSRNFLPLMAIFTDAEEFKGVKQQLKVFCLSFRQFDVFYWTGLQNNRCPAVNTSQMMMISLYRTIESFSCWKVSTSNQSFLLKTTKMSINCSQSHIRRAFDQGTMKLLATHFISAMIQFFQYLLLTGRKTSNLFDHTLVFESHTYLNISLLFR